MSIKYVENITQNTTLNNDTNYYIINASNNSIVLTLEQISCNGIYFVLNRIDTNANYTVTLLPTNPDTIDGNSSKIINPNSTITLNSQLSDDGTVTSWITNGNSGSGKEINMTFNHLWGSNIHSYVIINNMSYTNLGTFLYYGSNYYGNLPIKVEIIYSIDSNTSANVDFTVQLQDITNAKIISTIGPITQTGTVANFFKASTSVFNNVPITDALIEVDGKINSGTKYVRLYSVKLIIT